MMGIDIGLDILMKVELLLEGHTFLEGPRVDSHNRLYFCDIVAGGIFCRAPDGKLTHLLAKRKWIGGLALNHDGRVIASGHGGLRLLDPESGGTETLLDTLDGTPIPAINDIQPDGEGGLYCGVIAIVPFDPKGVAKHLRPEPLILLTAQRRTKRVAENIMMSNGIALSPDRLALYQAETLEGVLAYERAADGTLSNRHLAIDHPLTDGIAVDAEGFIWIAALKERSIQRFSPDGTLDRRIEIPSDQVTSLTFGGDDLRDLYVVTGSALEQSTYAKTGCVYKIRSDVPGIPTPLTRF